MALPLIAPSILSADFGHLADEVQAVSTAGADWLHVDVMDGRFVPPITIGPAVTKAVRAATKLPVDVHLMIVEPEKHIGAFRDAGADIITVHIETCPHIHRVIGMIHETGAKAGVALNPGTSTAAIEEVMDAVDLILVMTVNPGWGGQSMIEATLDKLTRIRMMVDTIDKPPLIQVDGGVKADNAQLFAQADVLVSGSGVFRAKDYATAIRDLKEGWNKGKS